MAHAGSGAWGLAWIPATCGGGCKQWQHHGSGDGQSLGKGARTVIQGGTRSASDALRFRITGTN